MILLSNTTDKIQLITSTTGDIDVVVSYVDMNASFATSGLGRQLTNITTGTTTDILAAPGASTTRNLKQLTVRNAHATSSMDVTVQYSANAVLYELHKATLSAGDMLEFVEGVGFLVVTNVTSGRLLTNAESQGTQRTLFSLMERAAIGTFVTISGTAYYVYVGRITQAITVAFVEGVLTTNGAGTQTAEVGLFSSPTAPAKAAQTLTKIAATGTVDTLTAGATKVFRNTSSFAQAVAAGTHLWAAMRTAMATTQPTVGGLAGDFSQAHILTTTGGGALTGLTTTAGTIPTIGTATVAPDIRVTLD